MNFDFENIYIIDKNEKKEIFHLNELSNYLDLEYNDNHVIRRSIINRSYFYVEDKKIFFSKKINNLLDFGNKKRLDFKVIESYRVSGFIGAPFTLFEDLYCIPFLSKIKTEKGKLLLKFSLPQKKDGFYNQEEFDSYMNELIEKKISCYNESFLLFSGGADSLFIFYKLLNSRRSNFKNIIVKMKGLEGEFYKATKISSSFSIKYYVYKQYNNSIKNNFEEYLDNYYEPLQDPVAPFYREIIDNYDKGVANIFLDGQGADTLLHGLPHNLIVNMYSPNLKFIFNFLLFFFPSSITPNTRIRRLIYRAEKIINAFSKSDWMKCFLSTINISEKDGLYPFYRDKLDLFFKNFKCKHKAISLFFIIFILETREMQKYRILKRNKNIFLPFLDENLIEKVFSTKTKFFINKLYKKKPIYKSIAKYGKKISIFKTSPFYIEIPSDNGLNDYTNYSINYISKNL